MKITAVILFHSEVSYELQSQIKSVSFIFYMRQWKGWYIKCLEKAEWISLGGAGEIIILQLR